MVLLVSEEMYKCEVEWKEVSSSIIWVKLRRCEVWVFVSVYGPGSERSERIMRIVIKRV